MCDEDMIVEDACPWPSVATARADQRDEADAAAPQPASSARQAAFDKLLKEAAGSCAPASSWDAASVRLRALPRTAQGADAGVQERVVTGVYWVKLAEGTVATAWAAQQPWFANVTCQPHKNSLAPGKPATFAVWYTHATRPNWIGLPRFYGMSIYGPPDRDARSEGLPMQAAARLDNADKPLRDYQVRARDSALAHLRSWGGATIVADCGAGKTLTALAIAMSLRRKTLVVCNRSFLMHQWRHEVEGKGWTWADDNQPVQPPASHGGDVSRLQRRKCDACKRVEHRDAAESSASSAAVAAAQACPHCAAPYVRPWVATVPPHKGLLADVRVGWMQGPYAPDKQRRSAGAQLAHQADTVPSDIEDKDVVVASIDSLCQCGYPKEVLAPFGLVIVDEMHHLAAQTLSQVLPQLPARYVLGVSATPDRVDGLEHVLYWLAGPTCFVYKRLPEITGLRGTVHVQQLLFTAGERKEVVYRNGQLGFAAMVSALAEDSVRNELLLKLAADCVQDGRQKTLIVTSIVEHARWLRATLVARGIVPDAKAFLVFGGCSAASVAAAKSDAAQLVVATYQFLSEGWDDASIDAMVLALPRSQVQQTIGRCERVKEGKRTPLVYDVVDTFSVFEAMAFKRAHFYKSRGFFTRRVPVDSGSSAEVQVGSSD